jgi:hypothetical protein
MPPTRSSKRPPPRSLTESPKRSDLVVR